MVVFSSWIYYILTIISVFILRRKYPEMKRPYKVWGYPYLPIIVVLASTFILVNTLLEDPRSSLIGLIVPLIGVPVYFLFRRHMASGARQEEEQAA
jgi:APA family basic amino acid/polyamine antiporter